MARSGRSAVQVWLWVSAGAYFSIKEAYDVLDVVAECREVEYAFSIAAFRMHNCSFFEAAAYAVHD